MLRTCHPLAASLIAGSLFLSGCGNLSGKPPKGPSSKFGLETAGNSAPAAIESFNPPSGNVASLPTSITVNFTSGNLQQLNLSVPSSYTITCGGGPLIAQGVTAIPGVASVTVQLPTISGLAAGTVCHFTVSNNLRDGNGNFVIGSHTATYVVASAAANGYGWNVAATTSYTSSVGTPSGNAFTGVGASGMVLNGLILNGGQHVNGIIGSWTQGFNSTTPFPGQPHGASAGGYSTLNCPAGYRMTGVFGRAGAYIDALGIVCKTADYSQTHRSQAFGGSGGNAFELSCPSGRFATDLNGNAGSYLNQIYLGCR